MMHFPRFSDVPLFKKISQSLWKNSKLPFSNYFKKCMCLIRQNFWWPIFTKKLTHSPHISSSISEIVKFSPTFQNFPPVFAQFLCFFPSFTWLFLSPVLTMMHLCIIQYMNRSTRRAYWKPLPAGSRGRAPLGFWGLRPRKLSDFWNTNWLCMHTE